MSEEDKISLVRNSCHLTKIPFVFARNSREEWSCFVSLLHFVHPAVQGPCEMIRSDNCVLRCSCPARNASQVTWTPCPHHFSPVLPPSFFLSALISFLSWPARLQPVSTPALHATLGPGWYRLWLNTGSQSGRTTWEARHAQVSPSMESLFSRNQGAVADRILMNQAYNQINNAQ